MVMKRGNLSCAMFSARQLFLFSPRQLHLVTECRSTLAVLDRPAVGLSLNGLTLPSDIMSQNLLDNDCCREHQYQWKPSSFHPLCRAFSSWKILVYLLNQSTKIVVHFISCTNDVLFLGLWYSVVTYFYPSRAVFVTPLPNNYRIVFHTSFDIIVLCISQYVFLFQSVYCDCGLIRNIMNVKVLFQNRFNSQLAKYWLTNLFLTDLWQESMSFVSALTHTATYRSKSVVHVTFTTLSSQQFYILP